MFQRITEQREIPRTGSKLVVQNQINSRWCADRSGLLKLAVTRVLEGQLTDMVRNAVEGELLLVRMRPKTVKLRLSARAF